MPGICSHLTSLDIPVSLASSSACSGVLLRGAPHDTRTNTRHSAPDTSCQIDRALGHAPTVLSRSRRGGLPGMFLEEVKRTEGSHDEKNRPRSPPTVVHAPACIDYLCRMRLSSWMWTPRFSPRSSKCFSNANLPLLKASSSQGISFSANSAVSMLSWPTP